MARPAGADREVTKKIIAALKKSKRGVWAREIARQAKLPSSTVHRYLNTYLKNRVRVVAEVRGLVKLYRIKR